MSDKQAEVKGHEWIPRKSNPGYGRCSCGRCGRFKKPVKREQWEQHVAQAAALASQVPAQPTDIDAVLSAALDGDTRRACNVPGCVKNYGHFESCERAAPVPAQGTPPAQHYLAGCTTVEEWTKWVVSRHNFCERNAGESLEEIVRYALKKVIELQAAPAPASPQVGETLEQEFETPQMTFVRDVISRLVQESDVSLPDAGVIDQVEEIMYEELSSYTDKLRAALAESEARIAALAESWEKEATGGRKKAITAARLSGEPLQHFIEYEEALERCAKELRALAAQPTPAPKDAAE